MLHLTEILGHSDPRDINTRDIRIISYRNAFARYFDEDPFGIYMPPSVSGENNPQKN